MRESLEWDLCFVMFGFIGTVVEAVKVERVIMRMAPTKTQLPKPPTAAKMCERQFAQKNQNMVIRSIFIRASLLQL